MKELIEELGSLAEKLSAGWHEGIEIDASDIMLMNKTADLLEQQAAEIERHKQDWNRFHHIMQKHGLHPGRTDDDLLVILDADLAASKVGLHNLREKNVKARADRDAALAKLSAMEKQEPFGYFCEWKSSVGYPPTQVLYYGEPGSATEDDWNCYPEVHRNVPLYTAPKVAQPPEALEALFTNIDHAISSGAWRVQEGSQTWETIQEAKAAIGGQQP